MRRRQIFAEQRVPIELPHHPQQDVAALVVEIAKGDCPKCGKNYPRGLHLHTRACKGSDK